MQTNRNEVRGTPRFGHPKVVVLGQPALGGERWRDRLRLFPGGSYQAITTSGEVLEAIDEARWSKLIAF